MKKAQVAYEFMFMFFFLTLTFVIWIAFSANTQTSLNWEKEELHSSDYAISLQQRFYAISQMQDGFAQEVQLAPNILGKPYTIEFYSETWKDLATGDDKVNKSYFALQMEDHFHVKELPPTNVSGFITPGDILYLSSINASVRSYESLVFGEAPQGMCIDDDGDSQYRKDQVAGTCTENPAVVPQPGIGLYGDCDDGNEYIYYDDHPVHRNPFCDCYLDPPGDLILDGDMEVCGNAIDEDCDGVASLCGVCTISSITYNDEASAYYSVGTDVLFNITGDINCDGASVTLEFFDVDNTGMQIPMPSLPTPVFTGRNAVASWPSEFTGVASEYLSPYIVKATVDNTFTGGTLFVYKQCHDHDNDTYIAHDQTLGTCAGALGYNDCDDEDPTSHLGNNFYIDADGDTFGDEFFAPPQVDCAATLAGYSLTNDDCDDSEPTAHPGGTEVCGNSIDEDCDGTALACSEVLLNLTFEGSITDSSSYNRPMSALSGGLDSYVAGPRGQAANFNGGYLDAGSWDISGNQMTIAAWIKPDSVVDCGARIISKATGINEPDHYWMLGICAGELRFRLKTGGTPTETFRGGTLVPNVWQHVAAVYDGNRVRLYIDGSSVISPAIKTGDINSNPSLEVLVANNAGPAPESFFRGEIDELQVYNRFLFSTEIQALATP